MRRGHLSMNRYTHTHVDCSRRRAAVLLPSTFSSLSKMPKGAMLLLLFPYPFSLPFLLQQLLAYNGAGHYISNHPKKEKKGGPKQPPPVVTPGVESSRRTREDSLKSVLHSHFSFPLSLRPFLHSCHSLIAPLHPSLPLSLPPSLAFFHCT